MRLDTSSRGTAEWRQSRDEKQIGEAAENSPKKPSKSPGTNNDGGRPVPRVASARTAIALLSDACARHACILLQSSAMQLQERQGSLRSGQYPVGR